MGTKKKAFELVFNLQWRNKPDNGGGLSNIIGIYDTPTATSNFETFKSYLLKNSGVAGNDARVAYVADNGSEWVIDSEEGFGFALSAFRLKAKLGEVIHLKLDKISGSNMAKKHSSDVETQFDFESVGIHNTGAPPEWFMQYMAQLKRDIVDEVAYAVSCKLQSSKDKSQYCNQFPATTKLKYEPKRGRKCVFLEGSSEARDFLKSKVERKLEHKLEKLEAKTRKIKEKKQAVLNKFEKEDHEIEEVPLLQENTKAMFNAASTKRMSGLVHHMMGGETYLHTWEVENTGLAPWTENTQVRLTWGSSEMIPSSTTISCPPLGPGETHIIGVRFFIPAKPGAYESYWNFYNNKGRFGNWLCCRVIVDGPLLPSNTILGNDIKIISKESSPWSNTVTAENSTESSRAKVNFVESAESDEYHIGILNDINNLTALMEDCKMRSPNVDSDSEWENLEKRIENTLAEGFPSSPTNSYGIKENELIVDLSKNKANVVAKEEDLGKSVEPLECLRRDNMGEIYKESYIDLTVRHDNNSPLASLSEVTDNASIVVNDGFDVINASLCEEEDDDDQADTGYVYIVIDGNKLAVPKYILRPDFLSKVEEAPAPIISDNNEKQAGDESKSIENSDIPLSLTAKLESEIENLEQNLQEANSYLLCSRSISSTDLTNSTNRLFIFPQNNPGFEVVGSPDNSAHKATSVSLSGDSTHVYTWANSQSSYNYMPDLTSTTSYKVDNSALTNQISATPPINIETFEHVPNYQQTAKVTPNLVAENPSTQASSSIQSVSQASVPTSSQPQITSVKSPGHNLPVHILPENLVSGAVNVASSAINTARSVINMIVPPKSEPGRWVNGHWVSQNPESTRAKNLMILTDMGFWDVDLNATLLARYNDDVNKVVAELLNLA